LDASRESTQGREFSLFERRLDCLVIQCWRRITPIKKH
jgi:hypothetical protein